MFDAEWNITLRQSTVFTRERVRLDDRGLGCGSC